MVISELAAASVEAPAEGPAEEGEAMEGRPPLFLYAWKTLFFTKPI